MDRMADGPKALIVNAALVVGLIWCYFKGYPLTAILITGLALVVIANALMYAKRRRLLK
jgi:hypothetical protein